MENSRLNVTLLFGSTALALALGLATIRFFEPRLFGRPKDLELVTVQREAPDFFATVLAASDLAATTPQINDPTTVVRGKPLFPEIMLFGPHDVLGFRNRSVPNVADILIIGDSQTYGNNALLVENWPSELHRLLKHRPSIYTAAVGGWAPPQYLVALKQLRALQPRQIIVALYLGNDLLETTRTVYNVPAFAALRSASFDPSTIPGSPSSVTEEELVFVEHSKTGQRFATTPRRRYLALNPQSPAIQEGLRLIHTIFREFSRFAGQAQIIVALIPTKESALAPNDHKNPELQTLRAAESQVRNEIIKGSGPITVVDLLPALRAAAATTDLLYPPDSDGHPLPKGYQVIAAEIARHIPDQPVPALPRALVIRVDDTTAWYYLQTTAGLFTVPDKQTFDKAGWRDDEILEISAREIAGEAIMGRAQESDLQRK